MFSQNWNQEYSRIGDCSAHCTIRSYLASVFSVGTSLIFVPLAHWQILDEHGLLVKSYFGERCFEFQRYGNVHDIFNSTPNDRMASSLIKKKKNHTMFSPLWNPKYYIEGKSTLIELEFKLETAQLPALQIITNSFLDPIFTCWH